MERSGAGGAKQGGKQAGGKQSAFGKHGKATKGKGKSMQGRATKGKGKSMQGKGNHNSQAYMDAYYEQFGRPDADAPDAGDRRGEPRVAADGTIWGVRVEVEDIANADAGAVNTSANGNAVDASSNTSANLAINTSANSNADVNAGADGEPDVVLEAAHAWLRANRAPERLGSICEMPYNDMLQALVDLVGPHSI